jgi:hypothetical protein
MRHIVEYMIGDWIMVEGRPIQIAAIHQKKVGYHRWEGRLSWVRLDKIIPIPLTSDLLIKNGFKEIRKDCYEWRVTAGDGSFWITLENRLDGIWDMSVEDYDRFTDYQFKKEVCGKFLKIHHLQHEFVGEGIKKEFVM